jgi:hypothetical protein
LSLRKVAAGTSTPNSRTLAKYAAWLNVAESELVEPKVRNQAVSPRPLRSAAFAPSNTGKMTPREKAQAKAERRAAQRAAKVVAKKVMHDGQKGMAVLKGMTSNPGFALALDLSEETQEALAAFLQSLGHS